MTGIKNFFRNLYEAMIEARELQAREHAKRYRVWD